MKAEDIPTLNLIAGSISNLGTRKLSSHILSSVAVSRVKSLDAQMLRSAPLYPMHGLPPTTVAREWSERRRSADGPGRESSDQIDITSGQGV